MRSAIRLVVGLGVCACLIGPPLWAQVAGFPPGDRATPPPAGQGAPTEKITFEVASIKQNKSNDPRQGARILPGGRIDVTGLPLRTLIRMAYATEAIQTQGQIVGGPSWIGSDCYDIVSKANCYSPASPPAPGQPPDPARLCGIRGTPSVTALGVTMAQMAQLFAGYPVVGRPVQDRTGLAGRYDWHLEFVPAFINGPNPDSPSVANPAADSGPNLFTAIQEQLGLKLQGERAQVEYLVIDQVERPTED